VAPWCYNTITDTFIHGGGSHPQNPASQVRDAFRDRMTSGVRKLHAFRGTFPRSMGITVSVKGEGEEQLPFGERTDGKPLADVVAGWIWFPEVVNLLRLSSPSVQALQRVDDTAYGGGGDRPQDVWQDPLGLKTALEELTIVLRRIRETPSIVDQVRTVSKGNASRYFKLDWFEAYDTGIEDAVRICDWAAGRKKRVALVAQ